MNDDFFDPIYKGCTSPSMVFGVPMLPFILGTLVFGLAIVWGGFLFGAPLVAMLAVIYGFGFAWAKKISRMDDQRLMQLILRARMRIPQRSTIAYWGAVSFSPSRKRD